MKQNIFDGLAVARTIEESLAQRVIEVRDSRGHPPTLQSVMVGNDPASLSFISIKEKRAQQIGIRFLRKHYPESFDPASVVRYIREKNEDPDIDGIIIQLPLPDQFDRTRVLRAIHPFKDVDGLHPKNLGGLITAAPEFVPPAVNAAQKVLEECSFALSGANIVMIGAGILIGKPVGLYFMNQQATVTFCSEYTLDISDITKRADVVVTATGKQNIIVPDMVKQGVVIIDFGSILVNGKMYGEVDPRVAEKATFFTPVPGGVGPLTASYLLQNTVIAAERFAGIL